MPSQTSSTLLRWFSPLLDDLLLSDFMEALLRLGLLGILPARGLNSFV